MVAVMVGEGSMVEDDGVGEFTTKFLTQGRKGTNEQKE